MKTITISQEQFDEEFKKILERLELRKNQIIHGPLERETISQLCRFLHYEICTLKEKIEKIYF